MEREAEGKEGGGGLKPLDELHKKSCVFVELCQ